MSAIMNRFLIFKEPRLDVERAREIIEDQYRRPYYKRIDSIYVKPGVITEDAYDLLEKEQIAVGFM